jgi:hypothetical protein
MGKCKHMKASLQLHLDELKKTILCYARNSYNSQACELTCHGMKRVYAENGVLRTTVPMNTSSTIKPHQPNNQPHQSELSMTYMDGILGIDFILLVLRFFTNTIRHIGFMTIISSMSPSSPIEQHRPNKKLTKITLCMTYLDESW